MSKSFDPIDDVVAVSIQAVSPESSPSDAIADADTKGKLQIRLFRKFIDSSPFLKRIVTGFTSANTPDLIELRNKNLAVAHFAGFCAVADCLDDLIDQVV